MEFQKELDFRTDYKEISVSRSILPDYLLLSYHQHISLSGYLPSVTNQPDESNEEYLSAIEDSPSAIIIPLGFIKRECCISFYAACIMRKEFYCKIRHGIELLG